MAISATVYTATSLAATAIDTTGDPARAYLALATPPPSAPPIATAATLNATFAT